MGREAADPPDPPEADPPDPKAAEDGEAAADPERPTPDSEGVYYISVEAFESRLPRSNPPPAAGRREQSQGKT